MHISEHPNPPTPKVIQNMLNDQVALQMWATLLNIHGDQGSAACYPKMRPLSMGFLSPHGEDDLFWRIKFPFLQCNTKPVQCSARLNTIWISNVGPCSESRIDWFLIRRPPPKQKRVINLHQNGNQPDKKDEGWKSLHEKLNYKNLLNSAHLFDIYFSAIPFFITRYHMPVQEPVDKSLLILNRVSREAGKPSKTKMQFFLTLFKGGGSNPCSKILLQIFYYSKGLFGIIIWHERLFKGKNVSNWG